MNPLLASTGLPGLDSVINNLRIGDNVVWQLDDFEDYRLLVRSFADISAKTGKRLVYMRFARHAPLFVPSDGIKTYEIDPDKGFESFSKSVHEIATLEGEGVYYVFDCLSDLLASWANDLMIGNFFMVTCPYLFELDTIAYFAILRNYHSFKTIARIRETTQLLLDVYDFEKNIYVHPLKVWNRYSPTMYLPHLKSGDAFIPITSSVDAADLFSSMSKKGLENAKRNLDYWDRMFIEAENIANTPSDTPEKDSMVDNICRIVLGRESSLIPLAKKNFSLRDLVDIKAKMIGSGSIGGKAIGMLLSRKILMKENEKKWRPMLEPHDSFYIASDVFYTYIVENGWWKLFMEQKTKEGYFTAARSLHDYMLKGKFPHDIRSQFQEMLEYFGQSPIIIRSSSLLEDSFGNLFAGKYESIFCVNQGSPDDRYQAFEAAVRRVFASIMNTDALTYRLERGLDKKDEQMALLVQRVSGSHRKHFFFPDMAGVGISYNTFVWKEDMDPQAGMLRLVMGLGTRAVNRVEDDYPRIIALDSPMTAPVSGIEDLRRFSQHKLDLLNTEKNLLESVPVGEVLNLLPGTEMDLIGEKDDALTEKLRQFGHSEDAWILDFAGLLSGTPFASDMQGILKTLENSYGRPVDIEFTVNFSQDMSRKINLLQCRPLQPKGIAARSDMPKDVKDDALLFKAERSFMGGSVRQRIKRIIYIDPKGYSELTLEKKYEVARTVGRLNRLTSQKGEIPTMLMGPGRWGTTTPSMGIPADFSEINHTDVLVEISFKSGNLIPEISFGTHFFQDLVESEIFYIALFREKEGVIFNEGWLQDKDNSLGSLLPGSAGLDNVIKVIELKDRDIEVLSDVVSQKVMCAV